MIFQMAVTVAAIPLCVQYLPGVFATDMSYAVLAGALLSVIYLLLRPIAKLVFKALSFLTLGLLSVMIDAWLVQLCSHLLNGHFMVESFIWALATALVVNITRVFIGFFFRK